MAQKSLTAPRNGLIELLRFVFALVVLMVHTHGLNPQTANYPFAGGYIAVEFFLILSGFFAAKRFLDVNADFGKTAFLYSAKRFFKIAAAAFIPTLINYLVVYWNRDLEELPYMFYEILLTPMSGVYKTFVNLPLWYLSAYFICIPIFTYLIAKSKDFFVNIGSVIVPLIVYGGICRNNECLDVWAFDCPIPFVGALRVMAGLCMGLNCYRLYGFMKNSIKPSLIKVLPYIGMALTAVVLIYVYFFTKTYADYMLVLVLCIATACIFAGTPHKYVLNNKFFCFLGKWSMYIYVSHWTIRFIIPQVFTGLAYEQLVPIYLVVSLVYSLIIMLAAELFNKLIHHVLRKAAKNDTEV